MFYKNKQKTKTNWEYITFSYRESKIFLNGDWFLPSICSGKGRGAMWPNFSIWRKDLQFFMYDCWFRWEGPGEGRMTDANILIQV